jgi:hypothetical protein
MKTEDFTVLSMLAAGAELEVTTVITSAAAQRRSVLKLTWVWVGERIGAVYTGVPFWLTTMLKTWLGVRLGFTAWLGVSLQTTATLYTPAVGTV